jgi:hypothetical protein
VFIVRYKPNSEMLRSWIKGFRGLRSGSTSLLDIPIKLLHSTVLWEDMLTCVIVSLEGTNRNCLIAVKDSNNKSHHLSCSHAQPLMTGN